MMRSSLLIMCIVALSCDSAVIDPPPPPPGPLQDGIWPLRVGASWTFEETRPNPAVQPDTIRTQVVREYSGTRDGFVLRFYDNDFLRDTTYQWAVTNTDYGLEEIAVFTASDTLDLDLLRNPYPATVGTIGATMQVSNQTLEIVPHDTLYSELISTNDTLSTPAGEFICYVYKTYRPPPPDVGLGHDIYRYFAPHVGQVGWRVTRENEFDNVVLMGQLIESDLLE